MVRKYLVLVMLLLLYFVSATRETFRRGRGGKSRIVPNEKFNNVHVHESRKRTNDYPLNMVTGNVLPVPLTIYKNILLNKREANESTIVKKGTTLRICTNAPAPPTVNISFQGPTPKSDGKLGAFFKKISGKIGLSNTQNSTTKSPKIYIEHHEGSPTPESSILKQLVNKVLNKNSNMTTISGPSTCPTLRIFKEPPFRHKGEHRYHVIPNHQAGHGDKTTVNVAEICLTYTPTTVCKVNATGETHAELTTKPQLGKAVQHKVTRTPTCCQHCDNDIKDILPVQ